MTANDRGTDSAKRTSYQNKKVVLRAEKGDRVIVEGERYKIQRRNDTYFGPCLKMRHGNTRYQITAPGPQSQLLLWEQNDGGEWIQVGEVNAELEADKQYDICPQCGEPIRTAAHESAIYIAGRCPEA